MSDTLKPEILYVCDSCADHSPESCGRPYANEIRLAPNGRWLCDCCYDGEACETDDGEDWPSFDKAPQAPELLPRPTGTLVRVDEVEGAIERRACMTAQKLGGATNPETIATLTGARLELGEVLAAIRSLPTAGDGGEERLREALKPFAFLNAPDEFQSTDGGCTEAIIDDADVQRARAALDKESGQ